MHEELKRLTEKVDSIEKLLIQLTTQRQETDVGNGNGSLLSLQQAADFLHLSVSRMYSLIYQKKLIPVQRTGRSKILFSKEELIRYFGERELREQGKTNTIK